MKLTFAYLTALSILISACGGQPVGAPIVENLPPVATETTAAIPSEAPVPQGILFYTTRDNGDSEIYSMNPDGSNPINLTNTEGYDGVAAMALDGTRIVFTSQRDGDDPFPGANNEIYVMNADGSGLVRLTENQLSDVSPVWSPDGSKIAFIRFDGNEQIFIMNADGSGAFNFSNDTHNYRNPAWSPDGTQIAFTSDRASTDPLNSTDIFVMNVDGSGLTQLTFNTTFDSGPVWSPDGTKIAFNCDQEICVMKSDGTDLRNVTNRPDSGEFLGSWSPDGTQLAFDSSMDNFAGEIYILDLATGEVTRLTNNEFSDRSPVWYGQ